MPDPSIEARLADLGACLTDLSQQRPEGIDLVIRASQVENVWMGLRQVLDEAREDTGPYLDTIPLEDRGAMAARVSELASK